MFSLNLKDSLLAYQEFYDKMHKEKRGLHQAVKSKFNVQILELQGQGMDIILRKEALKS